MARLIRDSRIGGPLAWSNWARCVAWPARSTERYTGPWDKATRHPILVVGTRFDPATPYVNARRVANLLGNAILLTHDGYGHTSEADPSACIVRATSRYLVQLITPPKGTVCASDRKPFDPNFGLRSGGSPRFGHDGGGGVTTRGAGVPRRRRDTSPPVRP